MNKEQLLNLIIPQPLFGDTVQDVIKQVMYKHNELVKMLLEELDKNE